MSNFPLGQLIVRSTLKLGLPRPSAAHSCCYHSLGTWSLDIARFTHLFRQAEVFDMWGALGLASAACAGIGYLIQSSAETNRKIADFLERDVRRTSIRDIVKSVEDSATNAYKSSNVYEFAVRCNAS